MFITILIGMSMFLCVLALIIYCVPLRIIIAVTDNPRHSLRIMIGIFILLALFYAVGLVGARWIL